MKWWCLALVWVLVAGLLTPSATRTPPFPNVYLQKGPDGDAAGEKGVSSSFYTGIQGHRGNRGSPSSLSKRSPHFINYDDFFSNFDDFFSNFDDFFSNSFPPMPKLGRPLFPSSFGSPSWFNPWKQGFPSMNFGMANFGGRQTGRGSRIGGNGIIDSFDSMFDRSNFPFKSVVRHNVVSSSTGSPGSGIQITTYADNRGLHPPQITVYSTEKLHPDPYPNQNHIISRDHQNPFTTSGSNPYTNSGSNPYTNLGSNPYTNSGSNHHTNSGSYPYTNSGSNPYTNSGSNPYTNSGLNPYTNSGSNTGTNARTGNYYPQANYPTRKRNNIKNIDGASGSARGGSNVGNYGNQRLTRSQGISDHYMDQFIDGDYQKIPVEGNLVQQYDYGNSLGLNTKGTNQNSGMIFGGLSDYGANPLADGYIEYVDDGVTGPTYHNDGSATDGSFWGAERLTTSDMDGSNQFASSEPHHVIYTYIIPMKNVGVDHREGLNGSPEQPNGSRKRESRHKKTQYQEVRLPPKTQASGSGHHRDGPSGSTTHISGNQGSSYTFDGSASSSSSEGGGSGGVFDFGINIDSDSSPARPVSDPRTGGSGRPSGSNVGGSFSNTQGRGNSGSNGGRFNNDPHRGGTSNSAPGSQYPHGSVNQGGMDLRNPDGRVAPVVGGSIPSGSNVHPPRVGGSHIDLSPINTGSGPNIHPPKIDGSYNPGSNIHPSRTGGSYHGQKPNVGGSAVVGSDVHPSINDGSHTGEVPIMVGLGPSVGSKVHPSSIVGSQSNEIPTTTVGGSNVHPSRVGGSYIGEDPNSTPSGNLGGSDIPPPSVGGSHYDKLNAGGSVRKEFNTGRSNLSGIGSNVGSNAGQTGRVDPNRRGSGGRGGSTTQHSNPPGSFVPTYKANWLRHPLFQIGSDFFKFGSGMGGSGRGGSGRGGSGRGGSGLGGSGQSNGAKQPPNVGGSVSHAADPYGINNPRPKFGSNLSGLSQNNKASYPQIPNINGSPFGSGFNFNHGLNMGTSSNVRVSDQLIGINRPTVGSENINAFNPRPGSRTDGSQNMNSDLGIPNKMKTLVSGFHESGESGSSAAIEGNQGGSYTFGGSASSSVSATGEHSGSFNFEADIKDAGGSVPQGHGGGMGTVVGSNQPTGSPQAGINNGVGRMDGSNQPIGSLQPSNNNGLGRMDRSNQPIGSLRPGNYNGIGGLNHPIGLAQPIQNSGIGRMDGSNQPIGSLQPGQNNGGLNQPIGSLQPGQNNGGSMEPIGSLQPGQNNGGSMQPTGSLPPGQNNGGSIQPTGSLQPGQKYGRLDQPTGSLQPTQYDGAGRMDGSNQHGGITNQRPGNSTPPGNMDSYEPDTGMQGGNKPGSTPLGSSGTEMYDGHFGMGQLPMGGSSPPGDSHPTQGSSGSRSDNPGYILVPPEEANHAGFKNYEGLNRPEPPQSEYDPNNGYNEQGSQRIDNQVMDSTYPATGMADRGNDD